MRRFRIVLTTNERVVTKYVDAKTREEVRELVKGLIEDNELGKLKKPAEIIEVNPETNRRVKGRIKRSFSGVKVRR